MTLTRREKTMVIAGLVIVAVVAYIFYFLVPYFNNTTDATSRYNAAQSQLNVLKLKENGVAQLKSKISDLDNQLKSQGSGVPVGIDHARILLYLQKITDTRAESVAVNIPADSVLTDKFLVQGVTMDFRTTYPDFLSIIGDLKKNELFNRVTFLKVDYSPEATAQASPDGSGAPDATAPAQPSVGKDVLAVHLELSFYAMQPTDGNTASEPIAPSTGDRSTSLMPNS